MKFPFFFAAVLALSGLAGSAQAFTGIETAPAAANSAQVRLVGQRFFFGFQNPYNYGFRRDHGQGYGQGYRKHPYSDRLSRRSIIRYLLAQEYCNISRVRFRRGLYHARAQDAYGRRVRLLIDPYSGHVLRQRYRY